MATELPVIDLREFRTDQWHPELDAACRVWGCFQIVGHGLSAELLEETRAQMVRFFALPREEKLAILAS